MLANTILNKIIIFTRKTGIIPEGTKAYCVGVSDGFAFLYTRSPILGGNNIKVSLEVIKKNCIIKTD